MPNQGNINPTDSIAEMVQGMLPNTLPSGVKFSMPFVVVENLAANASVNSVQNPSDSDCMVAGVGQRDHGGRCGDHRRGSRQRRY